MNSETEKQSLEVTTRNLLDLRPRRETKKSPLIQVTLRGGRVINGYLKTTPKLEQRGKPGIHRVELYVVDAEKIFEGQKRVTGDKVLAIHA